MLIFLEFYGYKFNYISFLISECKLDYYFTSIKLLKIKTIIKIILKEKGFAYTKNLTMLKIRLWKTARS